MIFDILNFYKKKGFSLVEALVSVVIFSVTFIAFMSFSTYGVKVTQKSQERTNVDLIAYMILEDIQILKNES